MVCVIVASHKVIYGGEAQRVEDVADLRAGACHSSVKEQCFRGADDQGSVSLADIDVNDFNLLTGSAL
jgi:hypothetical protein